MDVVSELVELTYLRLASWNEQARPLIARGLSKRYQRVTEDALLDDRGAGEKCNAMIA